MPRLGTSLLPAGPSDPPEHPSGRPRRRANPVVIAVILLSTFAAIITFLFFPGQDHAAKGPAATTVAYTEVSRGTLSTQESIRGALGHGTTRTIRAGRDGIVTWLPSTGTKLVRGDTVYRVDNRPVPLFFGRTPLYRRIGTIDQVGPDIRMIADNLRALGYFVGSQPGIGAVIVHTSTPAPAEAVPKSAPEATPESAHKGATPVTTSPPAAVRVTRTTVHAGDAVLTPTLRAAIKSWQRDLGLPVTGRVGIGSVLVQRQPVRVSSLFTQLGDPATGDLMRVTGTAKVITVNAEAGQAASVERGGRATVTLPDSRTATARVTSVGTTLDNQDGAEGDPPKLTITLVLDKPTLLKKLDSADLEVAFPAETHKNVLTVPVGALLALSEGGYAVQPASGGLIPVDTGIFSKGLVEISGIGLSEDLKVVTTS